MILLKLLTVEVLIHLTVYGSPLGNFGNGCEKFWLDVIGNHFDGGNCGQDAVEEEIHKARVTKREDTPKTSENSALGTIGNLMNVVNSNLNLNLKSDPEASCKACKTGIQMLKVFIGLSKSDEDLLKIAVGLCIELKIMTEEVCEGMIRITGPSVIHIIKTTDMSPLDICTFLMKTDCQDTENSDLKWYVDIPKQIPQVEEETSEKVTSAKSASDERGSALKVLHISDTHFDPHYKEGTWGECSLPLCCRDTTGEPTPNATLGGRWGGWKCDVPEQTFDSLLTHINKQHPDIDYVIWTGDLPPHDYWSLYRNDSLDIFNKTLSKLLKHFSKVPIYPALGNHDSVPPNLFPSSDVGNEWSIDWLYQSLEEKWSHWLGNDPSETLKKGAFYTIKIRPGLRLVSLNMNYCYYNNWWLILNSTDPMQELKWLIEVLETSEKNNEKVHIIGHVPPGYQDCLKMWQENYYNIIKRFKSTVTAQFFGHTHNDEFELFYDKEDLDHPLGVAYVGPSVTTYTYLNPGYRIYYVDGDRDDSTRLVIDHETWIMDLEKANKQETSPEWYKMYSVKDAYNMTSLTPEAWHEFFTKLFQDEQLMDLYYKHYWKDSPRRPPCEQECRKNLYCQIRSCDQYGQPVKPV